MLIAREPIVLVGGGGHCRAVMDVIAAHGRFNVAGIVEQRHGASIAAGSVAIIGTDNDLPRLAEEYVNFAVTIGQVGHSGRRKDLFHYLTELGVNLPTIVSPFARVAVSARVGAGAVIMHNAVVSTGAQIGYNCIVNTCALVEHDAVIGDHCHIATGAIVNGSCRIGNNVFVGSGAIICNNVRVADGVIIGAGCVVVESIEEPGIYVGLPARRMVKSG